MPNSLARIDLRTFATNVEQIRPSLPSDLKLLLPVKSDAYGHGLEAIARAATEIGMAGLAAASLEEGERIRRAGVSLPVLLLSPILPGQARAALTLSLTAQVFDVETAEHLSRAARELGTTARLHVNVDTGMRRFGVRPDLAVGLFRRLQELPSLEVEGIFTHLAAADSESAEDRVFTLTQIGRFRSLLAELEQVGLLPPLRHVANSAALIQFTDEVTAPPLNMARVATLFLGYPEVRRPWAERVRPVATLTTTVIALRDLAPGDSLGYGRAYRASRSERVAVLPIGYGSGYSPQLARGGEVLVRDRIAPLVGRICLEHTFVDVTRIPGVSIGDEVEVLGPRLPADRVAEKAGLAVCQFLVPALRGAHARVYV